MDNGAAEDNDEAAQAILLEQVWAQEAASNHSVWGGWRAHKVDADKDEDLWEDEAADQNETVKLPTPMPLVQMTSLLEIARFWEHQPEVSRCICDAGEDTNRQLPTICAFATEKERSDRHGHKDCGEQWWVTLSATQKE
ncbi:hypothetical protein BDK51DRAFT_29647 [Blyttiomyces helicus]|uniref:Uncharacterized protein n=1 Tax=Blyttiomyces helicus TaxID=388810 RepID=A0A4P9WF57_9FUNG|nr:hypothetical protein BDK51DRAFT_29647 [Blyttiomyces helicus]|eukprot:RKO91042.1 hypothetical protein BDK51DRAFT_29647 [Blyttiomyces helicus]